MRARMVSMPKVMKHNETGILVRLRDPKALGFATKTLLSDSTLRGYLERSGRKRVVQFFSTKFAGKTYAEMFTTFERLEK